MTTITWGTDEYYIYYFYLGVDHQPNDSDDETESDEGRTDDLGNMEGAAVHDDDNDDDDDNVSIDNIDTNEQLHNDVMVRQKFVPNQLIF